ncbi:MAG: WbqC family protein [Pirellulales bacterium]|nr:WbqC family protein [Pirellulales bacterium]
MTRIVILQPQFFPWVGVFEQIQLADVFVHFDDVPIAQGRSFVSRVQVKTAQGVQWLSVPIVRRQGQLLRDVLLDESQDWRRRHRRTLETAHAKSPYREEMLELVDTVYTLDTDRLCELNIAALEHTADYLGLQTRFVRSSEYPSDTTSSRRLLDLVQRLGGNTYVTGHGARDYLDHALFERAGVAVEYMDYRMTPYTQQHGPFTPYVSILDLVANKGRAGAEVIHPRTIPWREMLARSAAPATTEAAAR